MVASPTAVTDLRSFWSSDVLLDAKNGFFHRADRESPRFVPGVLLVFVHGINSGAKACWQDIPATLLSQLSLDLDVINVQYPVGLFSETSIPEVAKLLHTLLAQLCPRFHYQDLIFLVHSAGGLVLKQMLTLDSANKKELLKRTRHIFNFGVPHAGANSGLAEWSRRIVATIGLLCAPMTYAIRFASNGRIDCGRNRFYIALRHNSSFLRDLETKYRDIVQHLDEIGHSRPESIDVDTVTEIRGSGDIVSYGGSHYRYSSDRQHITVRGQHSSIKSAPLSVFAVTERIRAVVASLWSTRRSEYDRAVSHLLVQRCQTVNSTTGVTRLFGQPGRTDLSSGLDQDTCLKQLQTLIYNEYRIPRVIVSGPVGVGKSVVLRMLCRRASEDFLAGRTDCLVLFFPIDRLRLDDVASKSRGVDLWLSICQAWIRHTNDLIRDVKMPSGLPTVIPLSWLVDRLTAGKTMVLLDGVDEFISSHPPISIQQFTDCLPSSKSDSSSVDIRLVLAVRDAFWGFSKVRRSSVHLPMAPLGIDEVRQLIPGLADRLAGLSEADRQILLTPLVVSALLKTHHVPQAQTATRILKEAAESVLDSYEEGLTLESLSLVAWIYYRRFQRELSIGEIKKGADELLMEWQAHLSEWPAESQMSLTLSECCENLRTVSDTGKLLTLLRHSFFFPTTANAYSLSNERWRDFLVTFYVSLCVRHKHAAGLAGVALQVDHYQRAGDLLADFHVDKELVAHFVTRGKARSDPFIVGNLASLLGISHVPILPAASREIARACGDDIHPLGRLVATGRLAGRAARNTSTMSGDVYAVDLRSELRKVFPSILSRSDCGSVMRSLCLCYQRAFGAQESLQHELDTEDNLTSGIWDLSSPSEERHRSLQLSFLLSQVTAPLYPEHSVAHVHFLFLLTVARVNGVAVPEVCEQLPGLLGRGSQTEEFYRSYKEVPQVFEIYRQCQHLWESFCSPSKLSTSDGDQSLCQTIGVAH